MFALYTSTITFKNAASALSAVWEAICGRETVIRKRLKTVWERTGAAASVAGDVSVSPEQSEACELRACGSGTLPRAVMLVIQR